MPLDHKDNIKHQVFCFAGYGVFQHNVERKQDAQRKQDEVGVCYHAKYHIAGTKSFMF